MSENIFYATTTSGTSPGYEYTAPSSGQNKNGTIYTGDNFPMVNFGDDDYFDKDTLNYNFQKLKQLFDDNNKQIYNKIYSDIYPIGTIRITINDIAPSAPDGIVWTQIAQGRCLLGAGTPVGDSAAVTNISGRSTGGSAKAWRHTHNLSNNGEHSHNFSVNTLSAGKHTHTPSKRIQDGYYYSNFLTMLPWETDSAARIHTNNIGTGKWAIPADMLSDELIITELTQNGEHDHKVSGATDTYTYTIEQAGSSDNTDTATANLPPYIGVYFWKEPHKS